MYAVAEVRDWNTPATAYPRARHGRAEIADVRFGRGKFGCCYKVGGYDFYYTPCGFNYTALKIVRRVWMVDDPPHHWAMLEHAKEFHGRVLVAGLGLGLIVHALQSNPAVTRIIVAERERDVIDVVGPHLSHRKLEIVHRDFWDCRYKPDGVFYDLFVGNAAKMVGQALRAMFDMRRLFPTASVFRIHGFQNDLLNQFADEVEESHRRCALARVVLTKPTPLERQAESSA